MNVSERKAKLERHATELRAMVERFIAESLSTASTARMKMLEVSIAVQPKMEEMVRVATNTEIA